MAHEAPAVRRSSRACSAHAGPIREIRSHTASPATTNAFASSERPSVATETTIGSPCGDTSKASFAHCRSPAHSSSAPASKVPSKVQRTRAESWKSPSTGPSSRGAAAAASPPAGSRRDRSRRRGDREQRALVEAPARGRDVPRERGGKGGDRHHGLRSDASPNGLPLSPCRSPTPRQGGPRCRRAPRPAPAPRPRRGREVGQREGIARPAAARVDADAAGARVRLPALALAQPPRLQLGLEQTAPEARARSGSSAGNSISDGAGRGRAVFVVSAIGGAPLRVRGGAAAVGDAGDLLGGALELLVGEHGVPSNGRSRVISRNERQPPWSSRTLTVTGRGIRYVRSSSTCSGWRRFHDRRFSA